MALRRYARLRSGNRIREIEIDAVLERAFLENVHFCDLVRACLRISGKGPATQVFPQACHECDPGTIDLKVCLGDTLLLIENKIQAPWSQTSEGVAQPERYARTAAALGARSILVAPSAYIAKVEEAHDFDCLDYEELANTLDGHDRYLVDEAVRQALIPTMNPSEIVTLFFEKFQNLAAETAPRLVMKRR